MQISIILAHPNRNSFNHAIAACINEEIVIQGHEGHFHDLYSERFNPVTPSEEIPSNIKIPKGVEPYCDEISQCDGIVIIHPNWWGQPPAVLKGWIDRVLRPGVAYRFRGDDPGAGIPEGLLRARTALIFNTTNTPEQREKAVFHDPLETLWRNCICGLCGVQIITRRTFQIVITSTPEQRRAWLAEVETLVRRHFPPETS